MLRRLSSIVFGARGRAANGGHEIVVNVKVLRTAAVLMTCLVTVSAALSAHRLDEYLQAARLDLQRHSVRLTLELTPGAAVADTVIRAIDQDGDQQLSSDEQEAHAAAVVGALTLTLDGATLPMRLESFSFAERTALRRGEGTIRLVVSARHAADLGAHQVQFSNAHAPGQSVYLANVLVPQDGLTTVQTQRRSPDQRELTVGYAVSGGAERLVAPALMVGCLTLFLSVRHRRTRSQ
jgi:hypothetical protein